MMKTKPSDIQLDGRKSPNSAYFILEFFSLYKFITSFLNIEKRLFLLPQ